MKIPFDQYQRYKNTEKIVQSVREDGKTFSVLEVGANSHKNLEVFLPHDKVTYLDIELPEEFKNDPSFIEGDATNLVGISDNSFDIVIALDVLEHIPAEKRDAFFKELHRVSKKLVIICAPFHSKQILESEIRLNQFHKSLFGVDFIWLKEHIENSLPRLPDTLQMLKNFNMRTFHFPHGELELWERIMRLHLMVVGNPAMSDYRFVIDDYYNSYIFEADYVENAYRHFILCMKDNDISGIVSKTFNIKPGIEQSLVNKFEYLEKSLLSLYATRTLQLSDPEISKNLTLQVLRDFGVTPEEFTRIKLELEEKNSLLQNVHTQFGETQKQLLEAQKQLTETQMQLTVLQCQLEKSRTLLVLNKVDPDSGIPQNEPTLAKLVSKLLKKCLPGWFKRLLFRLWISLNK